ncbi:MAG: DUF427 domain-containing protein [Myxococcota bacterium]
MDRKAEMLRHVRRWKQSSPGRPAGAPVPGPGQESVWDYPRPPRVEPVAKRLRVELAGHVLADTREAVRVLETAGAPVFYLPPADVDTAKLEPAPGGSLCEWKGRARYWSARVGDRFVREAAWSYPDPYPEYAVLKDRLAFYAGRVDACWVGDERATPQPGGFYGGWVTRDILGPIKGEPGSEGW